MAESTPEKPVPESPTTAQPLDFDDDTQETGVVHPDGSQTTDQPPPPPQKERSQSRVRFAEEEGQAPNKPARPNSTTPEQQKENTLIEAFPSVDPKVVKAVLMASSFNTDRAFEALLGMSDPDYRPETPPPPPKPPRPVQQPKAQLTQMEQDELYARQLAQHYGSPDLAYGQPPGARQQRRPKGPQEKEYSFFDDDLPEIQKNIREGFQQTQTKVSKWIENFRKKMDGDEDDESPVAGQGSGGQRQNFGPSQSEQLYGIQRNAEATRARRSTDRDRYDADARVMGDTFTELELHDTEDVPPPKPARPPTNPNLFKPTPQPPQSGPVDEVDALYANPNNDKKSRDPSPGAGKSKKWQPLTSVAPNPEMEEDDPFALGDEDSTEEADKEKLERERSKSIDTRAEDTERLKKKASESQGSGEKTELQEAERSGPSGTLNKEAADLLSKDSQKSEGT